jgi:hypothetical protein
MGKTMAYQKDSYVVSGKINSPLTHATENIIFCQMTPLYQVILANDSNESGKLPNQLFFNEEAP